MSPQPRSNSKAVLFLFAIMLFSCSYNLFAQRGAGGGFVGGGTAGGGGLSGHAGPATGLDVKDDLKDFHAILAVQATSQQSEAFRVMLKNTDAASTQLKTFREQIGKQNDVAALATPGASLGQSISQARDDTKRFLDGFSPEQKNGLREITRKLLKEDLNLEQQGKAFSVELQDIKTRETISASADNLDRALEAFRSAQIDMGQEMSILDADSSQASEFRLPPIRNTMRFEGQSVEVTTYGEISKDQTKAEDGRTVFPLKFVSDLADEQQSFYEVLRRSLDKAERCGEQVQLQSASLAPSAPASLVTVQLHYERWACRGGVESEIVEGDATADIKVVASIAEDGSLRLAAEMGRVDAPGLLGELLHSGQPGERLRDKVTEAILFPLRDRSGIVAVLPAAAKDRVVFNRATFDGISLGRLVLVVDGKISVSGEDATTLTKELNGGPQPAKPAQEAATH
jgi:hypothetical protein